MNREFRKVAVLGMMVSLLIMVSLIFIGLAGSFGGPHPQPSAATGPWGIAVAMLSPGLALVFVYRAWDHIERRAAAYFAILATLLFQLAFALIR